jgi:hypothetical protein
MMMEMKICSKCSIEQPLTDFPKNKFGSSGVYSQCKICKNTYKRNYNIVHRDKRIAYRNSRKHVGLWRSILKMSLKRMNTKKEGLTIDLLGYSALELKDYITALFTEGMSWDNHGQWHIDHIKDVSLFLDNTEPSVVNALSNLRPMWATSREINGIFYEGNLNKNKFRKKKL